MSKPTRSAIETLRQIPWFADLPAEVLDKLAAHSRLLSLRPGDALSRRGEPQKQLSIVQSGGLELAIHAADGKRHVIRHLAEHEVFGLIAVLDGGDAVHDADAHGPTEILQIPRDVLLAQLEVQPALAMRLMRIMCTRFRQLYELVAIQHLLTLNARVAHLLVSLAQIEPQQPLSERKDIEIHLTQRDLSDMLGISHQSLSIELKKLERQGLIRLAHAKCVVRDPVGLERLSGALI